MSTTPSTAIFLTTVLLAGTFLPAGAETADKSAESGSPAPRVVLRKANWKKLKGMPTLAKTRKPSAPAGKPNEPGTSQSEETAKKASADTKSDSSTSNGGSDSIAPSSKSSRRIALRRKSVKEASSPESTKKSAVESSKKAPGKDGVVAEGQKKKRIALLEKFKKSGKANEQATSKDEAGGDSSATQKIAQAGSSGKSSGKSNGDPGWGTRIASFTTGCAVGIPIAVVRRCGAEIVQGTRDLVGETDNWFILAPVGAFATPWGCLSGGASGVLYGIKNAWVGSGDEPFGAESFSLGDM